MEKKKFVVPHVYILLLALILVFSLLSYVIPSNVYDYHDVVVNPETGQTRSVVDPETYHAVDPTPVSLMQFLTAVPRGMQESAQIIFFIFLVGGAIVGDGAVDGFHLFRAHGEGLGTVLHIIGVVAHGHDGGLYLLYRTAEPLAAHALHALAFQHAVDIVVIEAAAVRVHGALPQHDAVGHAAVRPLGGVLLRHAPVHIHGGVAHFQQPLVLGVGVLVGVDHRVGGGALGEEILIRHRHHPYPHLL